MAKVQIFKKDGTATPYFWSSKDPNRPRSVTVFKNTPEGVKRMRGVRFNTISNKMKKRLDD